MYTEQIRNNCPNMKKIFFLIPALILLNGCAESVALFGGSIGGASSGKVLQSSLTSSISLGVKHKTGKTPIGHVLAYADEKNPEKKKEKCFSFIERTRSEFCTIAKKQISITKTAVKDKALVIAKKFPKTKDVILEKENDLVSSFFQSKKSPRNLAIVLQGKMKQKNVSWPQLNKSRP